MNPSDAHQQLITTLYESMQKRDGDAMAACYHPDAEFEDAAFTLKGTEIGDMWRMLCTRGKDLRVNFSQIDCHEEYGSAHWEAWYTFSATGRSVHNIIDAEYIFRDGKIFRHHDHFSFWRWSRQALGLAGWLLGWTPLLRRKVRAGARQGLDAFRATQSSKAK